MITQVAFSLPAYPRGFHIITDLLRAQITPLPSAGILHVHILHTSAGLSINENADPTVRVDFESIFNRLIPEDQDFYTHNYEGSDDMPAHVKSSIVGNSISLPISNGKLILGTWQGIYLCEFRNRGGRRKLVATIIGS